jgi:NAD(P)-dependent dehydrogenase (short-subunit alcohol dehydrogenase family)
LRKRALARHRRHNLEQAVALPAVEERVHRRVWAWLATYAAPRSSHDRRDSQRVSALDVLVNNAGICPFEDIMTMTPEVWQRTIDINLTGAFHCTQLVARQLIEQGHGGSIIFITSLSTNFTNGSQVDYAASKAGLRMTMKGFAAALGPHRIRCNAVAPGMMLTPMTEHYWSQPGRQNTSKNVYLSGALVCRRILVAPWCSWHRPKRNTFPAPLYA